MKITFESELMENQKHAVVMAPDRVFEVLQSQDGDALFFSIGTDNVFYVTRELVQSATGWNKIDLSSALAAQHGGAQVAAKSFSVAQNAQTLAIDLALVLTVGGIDFLYLSLGHANTDDAWANGVTWTAVPFDAGSAPAPLTIADVFLMNIPTSNGAAETIFVDILRQPGDALKLLDRYSITPGASPQWNLHKLAADLAAGSIASCLGKRANDPISGIYTFGTIGNEQKLIFTPQYNYFQHSVPPSPAHLNLPAGASAIAAALNSSAVSNLFVSASAGLFLFTPDNQGDQANPVQIVSNSLTAGASALAAATAAGRTAVWGVNAQGNLFYIACAAGSEADPSAWSNPVPLLPNVEAFAFFLNLNAGNNVLFAHIDGQNLVQLSQDPITTDWLQRSILLPSTSPNDVAVYKSFTTHIQITDDNGVGVPNAAVAVTATSPVSVYLNDVYHLLSPSLAVNIAADATGVLTVVQETQSLAAVCFRVALHDAPDVVADINPMSKALATLGTVQNGDDLGQVQVTNADGTQQALVPSDVSADDKAAAAKSLVQFVTVASGLPQDGSRQPTATPRLLVAAESAPRSWGLAFANGMTYHEGDDLTHLLGLRPAAAATTLAANGSGAAAASLESALKVDFGDFFHWLKHAFDDVESFIVQEAEGFYHFLAKIGEQVYDVLLDCVSAVVHAVEFVFNKIKVFFEDLIKWLGFLFQWGDILRTHRVLKNIFNQYMIKCVNNVGSARTQLQQTFTDVQQYIDSWAGIADNIPPSLSGSNLNGATSASQPMQGQGSPQSNWGLHHLKSNAADGSTTAQPNQGVLGDIESLLQPLLDALEREKDVCQATYDNFKRDIIDKIHELSFDQLMKALVAIIADALLQSVENVLLAVVDVFVTLMEGVVDVLNAGIDIPVISWIYKEVAGDDLSLLDLSCLLAAIPITVGYKLIADTAPFPDNATTTALINAPDFASIQRICNATPVLAAASAGTNIMAAAVAETSIMAAHIPDSINKIVVLTGGIASSVGSALLCIFSPLKQKFPDIKVFPIINGLSYLLYAAPDIMGQIPDLQDKKWWAISNEVITGLMVLKSMGDMGVALTAKGSTAQTKWNPASPWLDFVGNILWQVPTTAAIFDPENQSTAGILSLWGGTCFDCNGIMSPVLADDSDPVSWGIAVGIATVFNLAYGAMSCAASALTFKQ